MDVTIKLDLPGIIAQACSAERIQPLVDKAIADALKNAISDATGYRSAFSEALKEQLAKALPHGLSVDDVAKFQHVLNDSLRSAVHGANSAAVEAALSQVVNTALPDVPTSIKLSELLELAREGFNKEKHESFYAYLDISEYGGGWLYLDRESAPDKTYSGIHRDREDRKRHAAQCLSFNKEGAVYALKLRDQDVTPASRPTVISKFDAVLMAMYVGRTTLEVDIDDDDVREAAEEQYD